MYEIGYEWMNRTSMKNVNVDWFENVQNIQIIRHNSTWSIYLVRSSHTLRANAFCLGLCNYTVRVQLMQFIHTTLKLMHHTVSILHSYGARSLAHTHKIQ